MKINIIFVKTIKSCGQSDAAIPGTPQNSSAASRTQLGHYIASKLL
jgi:hypothetical protein